MAEILKGKDVVAALKEKMIADVRLLRQEELFPHLQLSEWEKGRRYSVRKGATKRCAGVGLR